MSVARLKTDLEERSPSPRPSPPGRGRGGPGYELESELARAGLRAGDQDPNRKVAWVNSVSVLVFLIGIAGSKPATIEIKPLPATEEASAAIVEPLPPPRETRSQEQEEERKNEEAPDTPQVVVVTPAAPSINFAVPTIGNLVVPSALAKAPPLAPLSAVAPLRSQPNRLDSTGTGGERPQPPYPRIALDQGQQGSVTLRMTVDDAGLISMVEVAQSSGFPVLDRSAVDFVKRHWTVPTGKGGRIYEATINYRLQMN